MMIFRRSIVARRLSRRRSSPRRRGISVRGSSSRRSMTSRRSASTSSVLVRRTVSRRSRSLLPASWRSSRSRLPSRRRRASWRSVGFGRCPQHERLPRPGVHCGPQPHAGVLPWTHPVHLVRDLIEVVGALNSRSDLASIGSRDHTFTGPPPPSGHRYNSARRRRRLRPYGSSTRARYRRPETRCGCSG